jgi:sporulation protein YabP
MEGVKEMNYYNQVDNPVTPKKTHDVRMNNRKDVEINGVKELDSFDSEEFLLETTMGYLIIRGQNLQLKNLNVEEGVVQITGKVDELTYVDEQQTEKAKGLFSKLFR